MNYPIKLLIVGAQKAGTSSFLRYFAQHPNICTHQQPEFNYFVNDTEFETGFSDAASRYFNCSRDQDTIVAKSVGIIDSAIFMERVRDHNPHIQLVLLLRHPVDRAYSSFWFARRKGWEPKKSFETAIHANPERFAADLLRTRECAYLERGLYLKHIKQLLRFFAQEQLHIYLLEDLKYDVVSVCQNLYNVCQLDSDYVPEITHRHNVATLARFNSLAYLMSSGKPIKTTFRRLFPAPLADKVKQRLLRWNQKPVKLPPMNPQTRAYLLDYYQPHNLELSQFLGRDLTHWNN